MQTSGTFEVTLFEAVDVPLAPPVETALPIGVARMTKTYAGGVTGHSATVFTSAYGGEVGTYVALEAFEGTLDGRSGTFAYVHSASTGGTDRSDTFFRIVAGSGTGDLTGIHGGGSLTVDDDGTHLVDFDYELN
ncbi:DUF3224 domain-containing protein [Actinomycetospora corticicola]|uniref:DUF3224 domain-containing protein n=1 Tax=Actinomycetospora corticicola TaxID=663602 RepID=A0A7Y9J7U4_9PSEU|nr:DUF3224 domain-containing protein [Actinomycetospora corticicola]NYD38770.1 hypothetical protein [Actinomycetospora corticicola]